MKVISAFVMAALLFGCTSRVPISPSVPERMTNLTTERKALSVLDGVEGLGEHRHRVAVDVFRGDVLLTGEVPAAVISRRIEEQARNLHGASRVFNYLEIHDTPRSQSHTVHENYLKAKLAAKMLQAGIKPSQYSLVVRGDHAYLMGVTTAEQADQACWLARKTEGVRGYRSFLRILQEQNAPSSFVPTCLDDSVVASQPTYQTQYQTQPQYQSQPYQPQSQAQQPVSDYVRLWQDPSHAP